MLRSNDDSQAVLKEKSRLRHHVLGLRRHLPATVRTAYSRRIWQHLCQERAFAQAKNIFCYASLPDEVQTLAWLSALLGMGKRVCLPFVLRKGIMQAVELSSLDDLIEGEFGIMTVDPVRQHRVLPETIDCVIVPGTAFGRDGARLGMGGGYYDRFLMVKAPQAFRLAAAYGCQVVDRVPMEPHDCRVDAVVTENGLFYCNR
jgi:5-formyltetrahydrofolate cyclo-ligase